VTVVEGLPSRDDLQQFVDKELYLAKKAVRNCPTSFDKNAPCCVAMRHHGFQRFIDASNQEKKVRADRVVKAIESDNMVERMLGTYSAVILNPDHTVIDSMKCPQCASRNSLSENGIQTCLTCRHAFKTIDLKGFKSNVEIPVETIDSQKRLLVHQVLRKLQKDCRMQVPTDLIALTKRELKKGDYTKSNIRKVIKSVNRGNDKYTLSLWCSLNEIKPPYFSSQMISTVQFMLAAIHDSKSYQANEPLQGPYEFHKCFQLLDLDHLLIFFNCLKKPYKHEILENRWKNICTELGWEFKPSLPRQDD